MAIPTAPVDIIAPNYHDIKDWGKWYSETGLGDYRGEIQQQAQSRGLSEEDAAYQAYYGAARGQMGSAGSSVTLTPARQAEQQRAREQAALTARQNAIAPAVTSLEASIPETAQKFATESARISGEVEPLKQRYQVLLDEIKGKGDRQVATAQTAASREFGARGIPASSTAYSDYLAGKVNPIESEFANMYKSTGLEQESGLRNLQNMISGLVPQEVEANRTIRNAIANLQAGAGNTAIDDAFRQIQSQEQQRQSRVSEELARQNQSLAQSRFDFEKTQTPSSNLANNFTTIGEGNTLYNLLTGQAQYTAPKTYKDVQGQFGGDGW